MTTAILDPIVTFKDLLKAQWDDSNIVGTRTPKFSTGWYDETASYDQITFSDAPDIVTPHGVRGDGTGLIEEIQGTIMARAWAIRRTGQPNPKQIVWDYIEEVIRIIKAFEQASPDPGIDVMRPGATFRNTDVERSPTVYWRELEIEYSWLREPN